MATPEDILRQAEDLPRHFEPVPVLWGRGTKPPAPCDCCGEVTEWRHIYVAEKWDGNDGPRRGLGRFCEPCFRAVYRGFRPSTGSAGNVEIITGGQGTGQGPGLENPVHCGVYVPPDRSPASQRPIDLTPATTWAAHEAMRAGYAAGLNLKDRTVRTFQNEYGEMGGDPDVLAVLSDLVQERLGLTPDQFTLDARGYVHFDANLLLPEKDEARDGK